MIERFCPKRTSSNQIIYSQNTEVQLGFHESREGFGRCLKYILYTGNPAGKYCSPGRPEDVPPNVPRTSPKDPIWPSRGCPDLTSRGRPNLTSWGRPEMTSRGRLNLTFKGHPWEVDSGRPQNVLRTSPRGPWEYSTLDV